MAVKITQNDGILEARHFGGWGLKVLGIVSLSVSLFVVWVSPGAIVIIFSFIIISLVMIFVSQGISINVPEGIVYEWIRFFITIRKNVRQLKEFEDVYLTDNIQWGPFSVYLSRGDVASRCKIADFDDYAVSRNTAEAVARMLKKPLDMEVKGASFVFDPEELEGSGSRKPASHAEKAAIPVIPVDIRCRYAYVGDKFVVQIAGRGFDKVFLRAANSLLTSLAVHSAAVFIFTLIAGVDHLPVFIFFSIPTVALLTLLLYKSFENVRIDVSKALLRVQMSFMYRTKVYEVPSEDIISMKIGKNLILPGSQISVVTADLALGFASGMTTDEELTFILENIERVLVHKEEPVLPPVLAVDFADNGWITEGIRKDNSSWMDALRITAVTTFGMAFLIGVIYFGGGAKHFNYFFGPGIHRAVAKGDADRVRRILEESPQSVNSATNAFAEGSIINADETPLHVAVKSKNLGICRILLENGANVDARDISGYTPLIMAADNREIEIARLLLKFGADVNRGDHNGWNPIFMAVFNNDVETARVLIENRADVNRRITYDGDTPIHRAAHNGNSEMIELLIRHGADVNARNKEGKTPLKIANERKMAKASELLAMNGATE